ncbi:unnamed protein product [Adineta steineri]|uniref:Hexosyltransferase n=1 Tax=Adineta steineri TaxID=433720 RepID=A0A819MPG1_9BILA|nr:unnamed protein product [Adineta steineri]CAF3982261.1 unnamed protein product [Adineta steineri]
MPRIILNRWKHRLFLLCLFFIGFFFGFYYWQIIIRYPCLYFSSKSNIIKSNTFYNHFQYRTIKTCENERSNIFLTIAILSSYERLIDYLPAILETWVLTTTNEIEIIIFIEEKSFQSEEFIEKIFLKLNQNIKSCLFIVKLKHVENSYPPQKKSFYAMKFLYTFYYQRTSWILRLDDNAYVNIQKLIPWLKSIDHRQALYIGQGGTGRQNGPAVHFPPGKYFCMGGSGVILSQQTLIELGPWLDQCFTKELLTIHEDVELGRCILTHVQISCTNAYNSKNFFYHHYGPQYRFGYDFTPSIISRAFILHPINNRTTFQQLYKFSIRQQENSSSRVWKSSKNRQNYVTFVNSMEIDLIRDIHFQIIDARWRTYIETNVQSYIENLQKLWYKRSSNWTVINGKPIFGYHRIIPNYGLELITEILVNARSTSSSQIVTVRKRFYIRQSFINKHRIDYREIINLDLKQEQSKLNLIVVSHNKDDALLRFIHNFQYEILKNSYRQKYFTLTIHYFSQNNSIINLMHNISVRYPSIIRLLTLNTTQHIYNRGLGRQLASNYFTDNQILFFLDVDLLFTGQALINTHRLIIHLLSISSCAVYFPIIYSVFSNMFNINHHYEIDDVQVDLGLFSIYGFGNVVVRKSDLDRIGGWEINNDDWGLEDVNLFKKFVNLSNECYVFRAVEPGLKHYYHKKICHTIKNIQRQKMCYAAEATLLGSQTNMVKYIFDNKIVNDEN